MQVDSLPDAKSDTVENLVDTMHANVDSRVGHHSNQENNGQENGAILCVKVDKELCESLELSHLLHFQVVLVVEVQEHENEKARD